MNPSKHAQFRVQEGQVLLAKQSFQAGQFSSVRKAAAAYGVPVATLARRLKGKLSREQYTPLLKRLTSIEEGVLIQQILDLDSQGLPLHLKSVGDLASSISQARGGEPVGSKWAYNFIHRTPELKTRMTRRLDYRRALCEDQSLIEEWFEVVKNTKAKHGICEEDVYNFDETGFRMGNIGSSVVVTASERSARPKQIQGHSQEWITVIQAVNSQG